MIKIDRKAAKAAGYTDAEINAYEAEQNTPKVEIDREAAKAAGYSDPEIDTYEQYAAPSAEAAVRENPPATDTNSTLSPVEITQYFGQASPYDVFSGGINYGVDYATSAGTPLELPEDDWEIEDAYYNPNAGQGYIGNNENLGYGNSVVVKNRRTGEKMRFSHLQDLNPNLAKGMSFKGGKLARTGGTGNVTGDHLDFEYYDAAGNPADPLNTPYANIIPYKR